MTITKEQNEALKVQAMLQGLTVEELAKSMFESDDEDDDIVIIEDEKPEKKTKKSTKKADVAKSIGFTNIEDKEPYTKLANSKHTIPIVFNGYNIDYKNQLWDVPTRTVEYTTELIKSAKRARDIAELFTPNSEQEKKAAYDGDVRYIKLTSYSESIDFRVRDAGYAKVWENNGKLKFKIIICKELKNHRTNVDNIRRDFEDVMREITA